MPRFHLIKSFYYINQSMHLSLTLFILLLISVGNCASVSPTWTFTNLVQAGRNTIVQNQAHLEVSNSYVYTYSPAFSQAPYTALGIVGFQVSNLHQTHLKFKINIPDYTSTTQLTTQMNFPTDTTWRHFKTSYIAVDKVFTALQVDYMNFDSLSNVNTGVGTRTFSGVFTLNIGPLDLSHTLTLIPFLAGIDSTTVSGEHTALWTTTIKNANSIDYELVVKHTTRVTSITSYILIVDRTSAENGYQIFLDQIQVTGTSNTPNGQSLPSSDPNNLHMGLSSFEFTLPAFSIDTDLVLTTAGFYKAITIGVWSYRERHCTASYPYYQLVSNLCYDSCPNNSINTDGPVLKYCELCGQFVQHCQYCTSGGSVCTGCFGNYELQSANTSCVCPDGYYESAVYEYQDSTVKCRICHQFCATCSESTDYDCITCPDKRTMNGTYCVCDHGSYPNGQCIHPCNDTNCISCDNDTAICDECMPTFILSGQRCMCGQRRYFDYSTKKCYDCHYSCQYCDGPLENNCIYCNLDEDLRFLDDYSQCQCISNYEEQNQTCVRAVQTECLEKGYRLNPKTKFCDEICGDGLLHQLYECDDGNNNNGDGCSSTCDIEEGFVCADNTYAPNRRSYCSYTSQIQFKVKWVEKDIFKNQINITYTMNPVLKHVFQVYQDLTSNTTFEPENLKIKTKSAIYDPDTQNFNVEISYGKDIEEKNITLVFKIPSTAQTFAIPISTYSHKITADNILAAINYNSETYDNVTIFNVAGMICYVGSLVVGVILVFFRKMMALQLIVMFQLVYFCILLADYSHPFLGPVQNWEYINGYNDLLMRENQLDLTLVSNQFKVYKYYNHFLDNCNVMIFVSLALYVVSFIIYLLSLLAERPTAKKFQEGSKFFAQQIGFGLMVLSLNNIIISIAMEIYTGTIGDFTWIWSKVFGIIAVLIVLTHIVLFGFNCHTLTDSTLYYKRHKDYTHYYPLIFLFRNILVVVSVLLRPILVENASIIALSVQGVYIITVIFGRPFRKFIDYVRYFIIQLTLLLFIVARFVEAKFISTQYKDEWGQFFLYSAYILLVGFILSFILTIASFIYHFCRGLKKQDDNPEASYLPPTMLVPDKTQRPDLSESKELFSPVKLNEKQTLLKSKQMVILDVDEDEQTASVPNTSLYDMSPKRKSASPRKGREKKKKNPYV